MQTKLGTKFWIAMAVFGLMGQAAWVVENMYFNVFIPGLIGPALGAWMLKDAEVITNSDGTTSFLPDRIIWAAAAAVLVILLAVLACTFGRANKEKNGTDIQKSDIRRPR